MVAASDLKAFRSTADNGGAITATQINSAVPNNLFPNVPQNELVTGEDYYRCFYFKNTHATEAMDNFKIWLSSKSAPPDTALKWGFDNATTPIANTAQTIANKYVSPTGVTWNTVSAEPTAANVGKLNPGAAFPIWLWLHVNANAVSRVDDSGIFTFNLDIPSGGTSTGGGGSSGGSSGGTGGNPPPVAADYKVAIAGDWGCGSTTNSVISLINSQNYDYVVGVGDNAYASASCWTSAFTPLKNKMNSAYGNHEYEESGGISPYKTFFGHSSTYFSFKFQNILFIVLDTNISLSAQTTFLTNTLNTANSDNSIVWRIVIFHHPMFGWSSQHSYNEFNQAQAWQTIMQNGGVSIVCTGHNHNWQRTHQVAYNSASPKNPTVVDSTPPFDASTVGIIHIVTGTGGHDSGGSLYSFNGSQPSFIGYANDNLNGVWEILASNSGNTLTCSFRDTGGTVHDTFVINSGATVPVNVDQFGITMLYPTKASGRTWYSKWNNGHARSIPSAGIGVRNRDPDDIYVDLHCNSGQGNNAEIDGNGIMTMQGDAPRMYINDEARVLKWNNVEMTVYYRYIEDYGSGSIHVHSRLAGRSEHQDEYICAASGHTMGIFESKKDGTLQLRKELAHPAYADDQVSATTGGEVNTWIGMKMVLRDEGGKPHVRAYRDTTDGANGGTWNLVKEKIDNSDWPFSAGTDLDTYNSIDSGTGTCVKVTPSTAKIIGAANSCYLRCDSSVVEFKKFSIREIDPT